MNAKISERVVLYRINHRAEKPHRKTIGEYIKRERIAQGLKQDIVCKDICSVSYYSRIENSKIIPSDLYIREIYKKFNKPVPLELIEDNLPHNKEIIDDFIKAIDFRNNNMIEKTYHEVKKLVNINHDLYDFIYYLYSKNLVKAKHAIKLLHAEQIYLNNEELLLFLENMAEYYIITKEYSKGSKYIDCAMKLQKSLKLKKASLLYRNAYILAKLNQDYNCLLNALEAYELFLKANNIYYTIKCRLLIGSKAIKMSPRLSLDIFEECLKIIKFYEFDDLKRIVKFQLATVYKKLKMFDKSQEILLKLLDRTSDDDFRFYVYVLLIDLLINVQNHNEARIYYDKLKMFDLNDEREFYIKYYDYLLINSNKKESIPVYTNVFIPYFKRVNNVDMLIQSHKELAKLYEKEGNINKCLEEYKIICQHLNLSNIINIF